MRTVLVLVLLAWVSGLGWGAFASPLALIVLLASGLGLAAFKHHSPQLAVAVVLMVFGGAVYGQPAGNTERTCSLSEQEVVTIIQARVATERMQYTVQAKECRVLVNASRWPRQAVGEQVLLVGGQIRQLSEFSAEFASYRQYLERRGIGAVWSYPRFLPLPRGGVDRSETEGSVTARWRHQLTARVGRFFPEPTASLVSAMVLAERGTIPATIQEDFRLTGTAHVLAISGLHVGIIATAAWFMVGLLPLPPRGAGWIRSVLIVSALWAYIVFIGAPVSAQRAGLFISLAAFALRLQVLISLPTVLLLTVTTLLSATPHLIREVGFQLSVGAVVGIFLVHFATKPWRGHYRTVPRAGHWLVNSFIVSLGATLGTGPLIALHFGLFSPITALANLAIVPPLLIIVPLALAVLLISFISFPLALLLAWPLELLMHWIITTAHTLAYLPGAYLTEISFPATAIPLYYVSLIAITHFIIQKQHRTWREVWE